jgi:hypothetical protein
VKYYNEWQGSSKPVNEYKNNNNKITRII